MKRSLWLVLFGLVVALPAIAQVGGDGVRVQQMTGMRTGGVDADSIFRLQRMTSTGGQSVTETNPETGYTMIAPAFLSTAFLHYSGGSAGAVGTIVTFVKDSSSVEPTLGYNRLGLMVYPQLDDSTGAALFAFSVRIHQSASHDSLSTYNIPKLRTLTAPSDTVGSFLDRTESAAVNDSSGTFPYERLMVVSHMNGPRGLFIPLTDRDGANIAGAMVSVVWRHIRSYSAPSLVGWLRGQEQILRMRADLVGRRD